MILPNSLKTDGQIDGRTDGQDDVILPIDIDDRPCIHCSLNHPFLHIHIISSHLMPDVLSSRLVLSYFTTSVYTATATGWFI